MTIDEAISHALEVVRQNEDSAILYKNCKEIKRDTYEVLTAEAAEQKCLSCAADHRQLAEWLTELKEAKRLLKAAVATFNDASCNKDCCQCKWNNEGCEMSCRFAWIHTDEALKLIGEDEDENS